MFQSSLPRAAQLIDRWFSDSCERNVVSDAARVLLDFSKQKQISWKDLTERTKDDLVVHSQLEAWYALDSVRGKVLCVSGEILYLTDEKTQGVICLGDGAPQFVRFASFDGHQRLKVGGSAMFCGIVLGAYDFRNIDKGIACGVEVVGRFREY